MTGTTDGDTATGPPVSPEEKAPKPPVRPGAIIAMLVVSAFVMILNETVLSVALQQLTGDLGVSATTVQWLTSGFLLTMAVVVPTTGFLLERLTPRQVFLGAMGLFAAGTLICALAPGFPVLLVGRVVQASGTAVMIPLLMTTVMTLVPVQRRGSMMGNISIVIAVAPAVGPTLGGLILTHLGWRWMFWSVLPLALLVLVLGAVFLRLPAETRSTPLDLLSVLLSALAFGGIVYGFATVGGGGAVPLPPWVPLTVGAVLLVVFVARQVRLQRDERALLDMRTFAYSQFRIAAGLAALVFMALLGAGAILLPLYLQTVLGAAPDTTGLAVLPGGLVLGLLGRPVGALFDRFGARPLVIPGALALAVSLWLFALLGSGTPLAAVIGAHVLMMAGLGLMMTPLLTASLGVLPRRLYSHGSAIMTTLQWVAGAASTAGLVTVAALFSRAPAGSPDAAGLRAAFMVAGVIGVLAVVLSLFVRAHPPPGTADETTSTGGSAGATTATRATAATTGSAGSPEGSPDGGRAATRLYGRVETGEAGATAVLTLIDTNGSQGGRARTVDGGYELEVPSSGTWYLVVSAPGRAPRADRLVVTAAPDGADQVIRHDLALPAVGRSSGADTVDDTRPFARPTLTKS